MFLKEKTDRIRFAVNRLRERLWVKPLAFALLSLAAILLVKQADRISLDKFSPPLTAASLESLLVVMASSMLVIATLAVASMVAAYASASNTGTPRAFPLVVADDVSQNALSTFIAAFIFSIVSLTAVKNGYFQPLGIFILYVLTGAVFGWVIFTLVRWVDRIARLGRLGTTIEKVERAAAAALARRRRSPYLCGIPARGEDKGGYPVFAPGVGYVQRVDIAALQNWAEKHDGRVAVSALTGTLASPGRPLASVRFAAVPPPEWDPGEVAKAFRIGSSRLFDDDPRFGLVVLSQIAARALSPGVNDPGTAIDIIVSIVRLLRDWCEPDGDEDRSQPEYDRVEVPGLSEQDLLEDAFTAIARDGAGMVEVAVRLQKALAALVALGDSKMAAAARDYARLALDRSERVLTLPEDVAAVRSSCPAKADYRPGSEEKASPVL